MSAPAQSANGKPAAADAAPKSSTAAADVGWQFVPQYYTMMHDAPERLHCFYNKKSTFVHGVEGEEVAPSLGQQAIHQKVLSLGLSNCKAFIHHIDTQPSFQGGILLQVIGEMSNASGPWRKFTQTFFLAEQPNGYYVLNDIFRYLKEDGEDEDEEEEEEEQGEENAADVGPEVTATEPSSATEQSPAPVQAATEPVKVDADILTVAGAPGVSNLADGAAAVKQETAASEPPAAKDEPPAPAPVSQEHQSEAPKAEEAKPEPVVEQSKPAPVPVKQEETSAAAPVKEHKEEKPGAPAAADPSAKSSRPTSTSPAPNAGRRQSPSRAKPSAGPVQPPAAPAAPAAPPKPRTWASTAAAKPAAWGTALATKEALSNPTTAASALPAAKLVQAEKAAPVQQQPQAQAKQQQQQGQQGQGQKYPLVEAAKAVQTAICFVKLNNWQAQDSTEQITEVELRRVLSKSAGVGPSEITKVEIVRDKACAFVEFAKVDAARRAIIASLLTNQGGGGGIKTDGGHRIIVESRKEKSERKSGASPAAGGQAPQQGASAQQNARRQGSGQNQGQNQNQNQHQNQNQQNQNRAGGNAVRGGRAGRGGQGQGAK